MTLIGNRLRPIKARRLFTLDTTKRPKDDHSVTFSETTQVRSVSPAPLIEGEKSNFFKRKKNRRSRSNSRKEWAEEMDDDEDYDDEEDDDNDGRVWGVERPAFDWDAFLNVDEVYEAYMQDSDRRIHLMILD